jgi:hypothetical protein
MNQEKIRRPSPVRVIAGVESSFLPQLLLGLQAVVLWPIPPKGSKVLSTATCSMALYAVQHDPTTIDVDPANTMLEHVFGHGAFEGPSKKESEKTLEKLTGVSVTIAAQVGEEGKLFGSVTSMDIAKKLKEQVQQTKNQQRKITITLLENSAIFCR